MELQQFQGLALRTESQIQGIQLNRNNLITLLKLVVEVAEILDAIKKAAFYNKTGKLETDFGARLFTIARLVETLTWSNSGHGPLGTVLDKSETIPNVDPRVFHGILGIVTESGELAAALLKSVEDPNYVVDAVNIQEEMSDIAWYKAILHDTLKLDWGQGLDNVIEKLRIRYPDKYSDEAADNRNLEAERKVLERGVEENSAAETFNRLPVINPEELISVQPMVANVGQTFPMKMQSTAPGVQVVEENGRRVFYVDIPEGISEEAMDAIIESLKGRVRYVDGYKTPGTVK